MRVYVEPVLPDPVLWILGHGEVAESLCKLGAEMGLPVIVDDSGAPPERFPNAREVVSDDSVYSGLNPASGDFVVIATQHRGDHQSLRRLLATDVGYIALIASKKRAGLVFDHLREAGIRSEGHRSSSFAVRPADPCPHARRDRPLHRQRDRPGQAQPFA